MRRRHLVIALALVLAFAVVAPTLGSQAMKGNSFANQNSKAAKRIALLAKGIAQKANRKANKNRNAIQDVDADVSTVEGQVNELNGKVNTLGGQVTAVEGELAASRAKTAFEAATVTTASETDYVDLGGPNVTVTVPASGLIEVTVRASMGDDAALSLFEDGLQVPDQDPNGFCPTPDGALLANPSGAGTLLLGTPGGASIIACGSTGAPSPLMFQTTPGQHTYSLRYGDCGCDPGIDAEISDRMLTVVPVP